MRRYADDVDVPYATLKYHRRTAEAWPPVRRRTGVGYEVHKLLAGQHDRFDLIQPGMTAGKPGWFELLGGVGDREPSGERKRSLAPSACKGGVLHHEAALIDQPA